MENEQTKRERIMADKDGGELFLKHAALIWQQDRCTVDEARFRAWCEGPKGYAYRLKKDKENE